MKKRILFLVLLAVVSLIAACSLQEDVADIAETPLTAEAEVEEPPAEPVPTTEPAEERDGVEPPPEEVMVEEEEPVVEEAAADQAPSVEDPSGTAYEPSLLGSPC